MATASASTASISSSLAGTAPRSPPRWMSDREVLARIADTAGTRNQLHVDLRAANHCPALFADKAQAVVDAGKKCRVLREKIDKLDKEMQVLRTTIAENTDASSSSSANNTTATTTTPNVGYGNAGHARYSQAVNPDPLRYLHLHPHRRARDMANARHAARIQLRALEVHGTALECSLREAEAALVLARAELQPVADRAERADVYLEQLEAIYQYFLDEDEDAEPPNRVRFADYHRTNMLDEMARVENHQRAELLAAQFLCTAGAQYRTLLPTLSAPNDPPPLPNWHWRRWSKRDRIMSLFAEGVGYKQIQAVSTSADVAVSNARGLHVGVRTQPLHLHFPGMPPFILFSSLNLNRNYARCMMTSAKKLRQVMEAIDQDLQALRVLSEVTEKKRIVCTRKVGFARIEHVNQWEYWIQSMMRPRHLLARCPH